MEPDPATLRNFGQAVPLKPRRFSKQAVLASILLWLSGAFVLAPGVVLLATTGDADQQFQGSLCCGITLGGPLVFFAITGFALATRKRLLNHPHLFGRKWIDFGLLVELVWASILCFPLVALLVAIYWLARLRYDIDFLSSFRNKH